MKSTQSLSDFVTCCFPQWAAMLTNIELSGMVSAMMASEGHDSQKSCLLTDAYHQLKWNTALFSPISTLPHRKLLKKADSISFFYT